MIRNRTVREALQFTAPSGSTDFHSFHRPPKKEKRSKKERNGCYYYRSNSPLTPEGEYYKGRYRVRLQQKTDGKAVFSQIARANRGNNFILTIEGDFGKLRSGTYSLEILPPGYMGELPDYPIELVDGKNGANTKGQKP